MCIIAFQEAGETRIPRATLEHAADDNPDGMGIMYPIEKKGEGQIVDVWKTVENEKRFDELWNRYTTARDLGLPVGLHFRIQTHGTVSEENAHPFYVNTPQPRSLAFCHNGSITSLSEIPEDVSDTRHFRDDVLDNLPGNFLKIRALRDVIGKFISTDKLLFLDASGAWRIFNYSRGKEVDKWDAWFSHYGYHDPATKVTGARSTSNWESKSRNGHRTHLPAYGDDDDEHTFGHHEDHRDDSDDDDNSEIRARYHCEICDEFKDHKTEHCPFRNLARIGDAPDSLVENGGILLNELDESEVDFEAINWNGALYKGRIICFDKCLNTDAKNYQPQYAYALPALSVDDFEMVCGECGTVLNYDAE